MNTVSIIIGNVCSLLATITDAISSTRKTSKGVLLVQNLSQCFYCIGTIVLKGYSGAVQNIVSIVRNFVAIGKCGSKLLEWTLVALGVVFGIWFNNTGPIGYLPIIANLQYTLAVFKFQNNERALKISFVIAVGLFAVFNFTILNYVGAFFNLFVTVTTVIMLIKRK